MSTGPGGWAVVRLSSGQPYSLIANFESARRPCDLRLIGVDQDRAAFFDRVLVDHHLDHVVHARQVVHHVEQNAFHDRTQPARPGASLQRALGDRIQRLRAHFQLDTLHRQQAPELLDQRILRLHQNLHQRLFAELVERGHHRQPPDQLGDQPELDQVLRLNVLQQVADRMVSRARDLGAEADSAALRAVADDLLQPVESASADEQDVGRVDLYEVLVRVLAAALRWHAGDRALDQLQQRLLHALARHVARDRRVVALARYLVDLVDIDDPALRLLDLVAAVLQQFLNDVLDVLADVASLGQRGRIGDHEWHVQQAGQRLCEQGLARPGRANQQDVALAQLDVILGREVLQALVVVVDGNRQDALGLFLSDHVLIEDRADLLGRRQIRPRPATGRFPRGLVADDVVAQVDALVADENGRARDQLFDLVLTLAAKRAVQQFLA